MCWLIAVNNILSAPSEVVVLLAVYAAGIATPYLLGLRKQPLHQFQAANFKTGDFLKLTFLPPQIGVNEPSKNALVAESKGNQSVSELFVKWIQDYPDSQPLVADAARLAKKLKEEGIEEPQLSAFFEGDLQYLWGNTIIYRALANRFASCLKGAELLNRLQLPMYVYCWTFGSNAAFFERAFEIARRIDWLKDKWALIPLDELEIIVNAMEGNDPLSAPIKSDLPSALDKIVDNPEIHDDWKSFWDNVSFDYGIIYETVSSHYKQSPENREEANA